MTDPQLAQVIAQTESGGQLNSVRFEPLVFNQRYASTAVLAGTAACKAANGGDNCSWGTAAMWCSASWGRYQIMGYNLYSICNLATSVLAYLADPTAQDATFGAFLTSIGMASVTLAQIVSDEATREQFIEHYNGPGAISSYWGMMQQAIQTLGIKV